MLGRTWWGFAPRRPGNARPLQQRGARAGCNCAAERCALGAGHKALMNPADVLLWSEQKPFQKLSSHLKQQQQGKNKKIKKILAIRKARYVLRGHFVALAMLQTPRTQQRLAKPHQRMQSELMLRPAADLGGWQEVQLRDLYLYR